MLYLQLCHSFLPTHYSIETVLRGQGHYRQKYFYLSAASETELFSSGQSSFSDWFLVISSVLWILKFSYLLGIAIWRASQCIHDKI